MGKPCVHGGRQGSASDAGSSARRMPASGQKCKAVKALTETVCSLRTKRSVGPTWMKVTCWDHNGLVSGRLQGFSSVHDRPGNQGSWKSARGVHVVVGAGAARAPNRKQVVQRTVPHAQHG